MSRFCYDVSTLGPEIRMFRLIVIFALAAGLTGCASSPFSQAPAAQVAPGANQNVKWDCVTEEGYGRYLPCGYSQSGG